MTALCERCGKSFRMAKRGRRFCSDACRSQAWQEKNRAARLEQLRRYREANREKVREANRAWAERYPERRLELTRRYRSANPEKVRAHYIVANEIRKGRLSRPEACERCGGGEMLHAHHDNYEKPLDVVWLCPLCHRAEHMKEAA